MSDLVAYVDGSCLGSPGQAGIGVIIRGWKEEPITVAKWIGHQDNTVAEYVALLEALQCALRLSAAALHVYSDSEVVVKQMKGAYICRSSRLYSLNWVCRKLARSLAFSISHIPRQIIAKPTPLLILPFANGSVQSTHLPREPIGADFCRAPSQSECR